MNNHNGNGTKPEARNVLGGKLATCCTDPMTGFHRNGKCETGPQDAGIHVVCARVTQEFLEFSRAQGNDLMSPNLAFGFPGLKSGDGWCLCAARWKEAFDAGVAPPVRLVATHEATLRYVALEELMAHALDADEKA